MSEPIIQIRGLRKTYGKVQALQGIDLDMGAGTIGLLGPNGAGKTTMIKLLLGLLTPDMGTASIAGHSPFNARDRLAVREVVGYMPEGDCLLPGMTAVEMVTTLARLTGLSRKDAMARAHESLDYVGLDEARYRATDQYSTGMKQRLKLAQALAHTPPVLLLDEPTNGMDPAGRKHMLEIIEDLGRVQGKNVVLCTHLLPDVEKTCDEVVVLKQGQVVRQGRVEDMTGADGRTLEVKFLPVDAPVHEHLPEGILDVLGQEPGILRVQLSSATGDADPLFRAALEAGARITSVEPDRTSLEQVFLEAVGISPDSRGAVAPDHQHGGLG